MFKNLLLLCLLFIGSLAHAQSSNEELRESWRDAGTDSLDAKNGFRSFKFDTPISSLKGFVLLETAGDSKYYKLTNDKFKIGEATLTKISYGFYKGRFASVLIDANGYSNCEEILAVLKSQYGEGRKLGRNTYWSGRKVNLSYSLTPTMGHAAILFDSVPISEEQKANKLKKAAGDL